MAKTKSFGGVTENIWNCVKAASEKEHGTKYEPTNGIQGTSTTSTLIGDVVLSFNFDQAKETVNYTIKKKPLIVSDGQIWNGIDETIEHCKSQHAS